jgi:2',3'-cyclic-nucleotide 2'-phosphodiesterase (5'-nucleotidase family)
MHAAKVENIQLRVKCLERNPGLPYICHGSIGAVRRSTSTHIQNVPMTRIIILAAVLFFLAPCIAPAQPREVVFLHTNDMHAGYLPHGAMWVKGENKPLVGGFLELSAAVDSLRKVYPGALLLDAGDVMTGNPVTEYDYRGARGGVLFEMMNMIGYDLWTPGNHDFDVSQENLRALTRIARFPTINANVVNDRGELLFGNAPYIIVERNGVKIGIIGIMSQQLYGLVNQNNLVGIRVKSPVETTQKAIDALDPKTDLIVALTHQGADDDSALAKAVKGLDIIVGGHSHTRLRTPSVVNGVLMVQAGSNVENLGILRVTVENDRVTSSDGRLLQLWARNRDSSTPLAKLIDSVRQAIDRDYHEMIGTLSIDWIRGKGETEIGQFIANAQREAAGAEIGFMNKHGIRKDQKAGPMTKQDLFEILPFANVLCTFQLSGRELRALLVYYVESNPAIEINGVTAEWGMTRDGRTEFSAITVLGKPLEDDRMYTCAASDYMIGEAKHYLGMEIPSPIYLKQSVFGVVEAAVKKAGTVGPSVTTRISKSK